MAVSTSSHRISTALTHALARAGLPQSALCEPLGLGQPTVNKLINATVPWTCANADKIGWLLRAEPSLLLSPTSTWVDHNPADELTQLLAAPLPEIDYGISRRFSEAVQLLMHHADLRQGHLARFLGESQSRISRLLGASRTWRLEEIDRITASCAVDTPHFFQPGRMWVHELDINLARTTITGGTT